MGSSFGEVREFLDVVTAWAGGSRVTDELCGYFLEAGPYDEAQEFSLVEVLRGLTFALHFGKLGVWLDHSEAHLLRERFVDVIEYRIGRPDEFWHEPDKYTDFVWEGSNVEDGLAAFDRWLTNENVEFRGETPLRVMSINTGEDFYLAFVSPNDVVEDAAAKLKGLGFGAALAA